MLLKKSNSYGGWKRRTKKLNMLLTPLPHLRKQLKGFKKSYKNKFQFNLVYMQH